MNSDTSPQESGAGNRQAALLLCVASIALTGAFVFVFAEGARNALDWLMPVGSAAALGAAALSLRPKVLSSQNWLVGGTLALAATAAVSTEVLPITTALIAGGAFATGLAFVFGKPATEPSVSKQSPSVNPADQWQAALFFDEITEIDCKSKVFASKSGRFVIGSLLLEHIHIGDRPAFLLACRDATRLVQELTLRIYGADKSRFANTQMFLMAQDGRILAALRPATKNTNQVVERAALSELAHELRTPLAAIVGFAETLAQGLTCTEEMRRTYPNLIASAGRNLIDMTSAILQAQPDSDESQAVAFGSVVEDCVALLQPMAQQKSITIFNRVPASIAEKAVKSMAMRQILTNLISNAIKFSPAGASVELNGSSAANGWSLTVTDNGNGLAPEDVARLGQRNFRTDKAGEIEGCGLGLAIVRRLVDEIGGRISFESRPGKGTQVTIAFSASSLVEFSNFQPKASNRLEVKSNLESAAGEKHAAA